MVRLLSIGGACLALALAAGCGDDEEDTTAGGGGAATTEAAAPPPETAAEESGSGEEIVVTMKDFAFDPQEVEGTVGQTVTWRNEDEAPHNAVEEGGDLKTSTFRKGGSDSYTLAEAGTIEYICTVHPQMTGTITVTE